MLTCTARGQRADAPLGSLSDDVTDGRQSAKASETYEVTRRPERCGAADLPPKRDHFGQRALLLDEAIRFLLYPRIY